MLVKFFCWLKGIKPRYFLSLDNKIYNEGTKLNSYRFKSFGEHNFPVFNYNDIMKNKDILYSINPADLVGISVDNYINEENNNQFIISEYLRGNKYRIFNSYYNDVLTGEEICQSPALLQKISSLDVYKIAYSTGFIDGRSFSKKILSDLESVHEKVSVTQLRIVPKN